MTTVHLCRNFDSFFHHFPFQLKKLLLSPSNVPPSYEVQREGNIWRQGPPKSRPQRSCAKVLFFLAAIALHNSGLCLCEMKFLPGILHSCHMFRSLAQHQLRLLAVTLQSHFPGDMVSFSSLFHLYLPVKIDQIISATESSYEG